MRTIRVAFLCQIAALCVGVSLAQEPTTPDEQFFVELEQSLAVGASTLAPDLERLRVAAASGDAASQLLLGRYLYEGRRTALQVAQGLSLLELAAAAGLSDASYLVGEAYRNGVLGMRRQPARALRHYEAAAEAGNKAAGRALAGLLLDQRYAFADRARGLQMLEDLAAEGDVQALLALGAAYSGVDGLAAINAYGRAAAGGSTSALNSLGDIYRRGAPGVPADLDKALEYYELLGRVGDQGARRKTADIFIRDEGGKQDIARAVAILRSLVSAGDAQASIAIGDLYARGEFTPIDYGVAISAYRQAADAGLIDAYLRLGDLFRGGTVGMRPDVVMAISVYKEAAAKQVRGYSAALVRLADLFRTGAEGLSPDGVQALAYYEQAIALDDDGARRNLAGMLLEGALVPQSAELAVRYLADAAERGDSASAMQLGSLYGRGGAIEADYDKSVYFYRLAAELGEINAPLRQAATLADGPLAADHRQAGISFLAEGVAKGLQGAATELARLVVAGKVPGTQPAEARDMLYGAALGGDAGAAKYLLQLYRDGAGGAFRTDLDVAERLLEEFSPVLGEPATTTERLSILAKRGTGSDTLDRIAEQFDRLPRLMAAQALERMAGTNENAYISLVQRRLKELSLFDGNPDGILTGSTIEAFRRACEAAGSLDKCDRGPLASDAVRLIVAFLFTARP
jgi:TPR repeat protein